ncbi:MAG: tetratricopeptide repeat protein [Gammaproteobacteria bacterium]|nr:tetratricopeptide repeat protein [Gammaproteobacteria bacterium]
MVDDILLTPEEQDERAKQWLKDNGMALVIGVGLGLGAVFGFNQYRAQQELHAEQASVLYSNVMERYAQSELADISAPLAQLKSAHAGTPYAAKAALVRAKQLAVNDLAAAAEELQWVIDNADEPGLQHAARIRLAKVRIAQGELDSARDLAAQQPYGGFDSHYLEILGDIAARSGDVDAAKDYYQQASVALSRVDSGYAAILELKSSQLPDSDKSAAPAASAEVNDDVAATPE